MVDGVRGLGARVSVCGLWGFLHVTVQLRVGTRQELKMADSFCSVFLSVCDDHSTNQGELELLLLSC